MPSRRHLVLLALAACRSRTVADAGAPAVDPVVDTATPADVASGAASSAPTTSVTADWCIAEVSVLAEDVCYVLPALAASRPRRLIVYLSGIVPPLPDSPQKRAVQSAVLRASMRAGVAGIIPRGRRGIGPAGAHDWWAWPTTSRAIAELTPSLVLRWVDAKRKLEAIAGAPFERTYLAGSSNGAYFLAALAMRGDKLMAAFPVDGFGAMSGGAAGSGASQLLAGAEPRPFYVGYGAYDEETRANARSLVTTLQAAHWPVRAAEHPLGHGANEVYLDEAIEFWAEAADGAPERE